MGKLGLVASRGGRETNKTESGGRDASATTKGGDSTTSHKINSSKCRSSVSPRSSHKSLSWFTGSHSFLSSALTLTTDTFQAWELNWCLNSANFRMRVCVCFSATLALWLQERRFSFRAHWEALSWLCISGAEKLNFWVHNFPLLLLLVKPGATNQHHHVCSFSRKIQMYHL